MSINEIKSIETFNLMWETWDNPTASTIEESISTWAESGKGFGSGITEVWKNKSDFRKYCEDGFRQSPGGFKANSKWVETDELSDDLVALWGEITITIKLPLKNIVIDPIRVTGVFKNIGGEMKLLQWHASVPDVSSEDEVWGGTGEPKLYENVSILFTDFVGFTRLVSNITPKKLVDELNEIFAEFDEITKRNGLEKIKTIGDAYMAAIGLKEEVNHAVSAVKAAKEMLQYLNHKNKKSAIKWDMRIGIHSGPAVGGTIGSEKLGFDLWGDTVNFASRIESSSEPNKINISLDTYNLIKHVFPCNYRGLIEIKDKRKFEMYFVN